MKNIYKSLLAGLACTFAAGVSAQTYVSPITPYQVVTTDGQTMTFTFAAPPSGAHSTAQLKVYFQGDYGASYEDIEVDDEDGNVLGYAGAGNFDCGPEEFKVFTFDATLINGWLADNNVEFTLYNSFDVNPFDCDTSRVRVQLTYDYCSFGAPQQFANLIFTDSVFCAYDSPAALSGTPAGGTFSGTGVTGSNFNPNGLASGSYEVTYTAADGFGCITHQTKKVRINGSPATQAAHACPGGPAVLEVNSGGGDFVWYTNTALTQVLDSGIVVNSPALNQPTTYYVAGITSDNSFNILTLSDTGSAVVDQESTAGDDNAGIAITPDYLYVVGNENTSRMRASDLGNAVSLPIRDGIFSDLKTGHLWAFWSTETEESISYDDWNFPFNWDAIRGLDTNLAFTDEYIYLSEPVVISSDNDQSGVFAGYGKMAVYNGEDSHFYTVDLDNGFVEDLGSGTPDFFGGENWADWGVLEYDGAEYSIVYRRSGNDEISRLVLPDGAVSVVQSFSDLSDMAALTFSPWNNRWYFHYEGGGEFGGIDETAGYVGGTFATAVLSAGEPGCYTEVDVDVNVIDLGSDVTICKDDIPVVLFAGLGYSSYTWNGVNNNFNAFPVTVTGTYTVQAIDEYGCTVTDAANVTVNACLGVEELELGLSVNVFPNPTEAIINLSIESAVNQDLTMEIMDLTGKRLYNTRLNGVFGSYNHSVDISNLSAGVYIIRLNGSEKGSKQIRIIKN